MDLRRQLVIWLGASLLGLMGVTVAINVWSLRGDVAQEVRAAERLALALLAKQRSPVGGLRHITITDASLAVPPAAGAGARVAGWLGLNHGGGQVVRVDGRLLRIAPDPASEVDERLNDVVRLWSTLLFFSGTSLALAWWVAHRALAPVRALEAGLQRLAAGHAEAGMPPFALREFVQVAAGIDRLAAALADSQLAQRRLAHQLIRVQEDERRTLAMELHDEMGQSLTAIGLTTAYLARHAATLDSARVAGCAEELRRDVRSCSGQLRAVLARLRPHGLDGEALLPALRALIGSWRQRSKSIAFSLTLPQSPPSCDRETALIVYRVVQEGITNVVRHSGATRCSVALAADAQVLTVTISDDGCGLDGKRTDGCGLAGMAERMRMAGGSLELGRSFSGGLVLRAQVPLPAAAWREAA